MAASGNNAIADKLEAFAGLLELVEANPYQVRAYRRAAEVVRALPSPVAELVASGRARELRGVGPGIESKLREIVETGTIADLEELEREAAPELVALGRLLGVGARRILEIGRELGVRTLDELRAAAAAGRLASVAGVGPKTEARLVERLAQLDRPRPPLGLLLGRARALTESIAVALGGVPAGDPRRFRDSCERLAVVCVGREALDAFAELPQIVAVLERDERHAVGLTVEGVPVEVVAAEPGRFGTELVRATGSEEWVAALGPLPDGPDEASVFRATSVTGSDPVTEVPPELREIGAPAEPPAGLVRVEDIRGELHCHTTWSDGTAGVLDMAEAARARGYEYVAVCDHTPAVGAVRGLDGDAVRRQSEEIAAANERLAPFRVLRGIEADIRADGSLDLPDDVLAELDWVQISLHAGQRAARDELTRRVTEAMHHPAARCLSHPTGRYINRRPPNALDLERTIEVALETGVALEINGLPDRLDLRDEHVRLAIEAGVPLVCNTDAHSIRGLGNMLLSVGTARRGGAAAANVLNTRPLAEVLARRRR
jgi:DNA polymerase (family 10)